MEEEAKSKQSKKNKLSCVHHTARYVAKAVR